MPEELLQFVPVVAHRLYGTKYVRQESSKRGKPWFNRAMQLGLDVHSLSGDLLSTKNIIAALDTNHGTEVSLQEIRAFFIADLSLEYTTEGPTVNDIWAPAGIRFQLVATADHMISSHYADLMPLTSYFFERYFARRFNTTGVLNLYFVREIIGAKGHAGIYLHGAEEDWSYALVHDGDERLGTYGRWNGRVITMAHEFGHFLGLSHNAEWKNVMTGGGTHYRSSIELEKPQWRIAQHRARYFRTPLYVYPEPPHLGVELEYIELPEW
jgi:hypothetical protein